MMNPLERMMEGTYFFLPISLKLQLSFVVTANLRDLTIDLEYKIENNNITRYYLRKR